MLRQTYIDLIRDFLYEIESHELNPYSVIIYGSVSRGDLTLAYSDLDILYLVNDFIPDSIERQKLYSITSTLYMRYRIKIHLRIRNIEDFYNKSAGMLDCGFTSCINKLRDGLCIFGSPIDSIYLNYIKNASLDIIHTNLTHRFSKLKYDIRALTSSQATSSNHIAGYKLYTIISQLAELIAYSNGIHFTNKLNALMEAYKVTSSDIFKTIYKQRLSSFNIVEYFDLLFSCETIIDKTVNNITFEDLGRLKLIELNRPIGISVNESMTLEKSFLIELVKDKGFIKDSFVSDGRLVINQYTIL